MKTLFPITFLIFLFSYNLQAQAKYPKHSFKIGFGNSAFKSVGFQGKTRYLEYNRQLFNRFSIGLDGNWTQANNFETEELKKSMNRLTGNAHLFFAPIQKQNTSFKIGFGASTYTSKYQFEDLSSLSNKEIPNDYSAQDYGFSVAVDFEIFVIKNWALGTRASYQKYKNEDESYFWGFNTGIRF